MRENETVAPYTGDDVLGTIQAAEIIGTTMLATMRDQHGATWFRVLDGNGNVLAKGP